MSERRLIRPPAQETPAGRRSRPGGPRRLPADLLRQASRRLEIITLVAAVLWVTSTLLWHLALASLSVGVPDYISLAGFVVSLALYAYLRRREHDPDRVINLGFSYLILMAFAIGVLMHWGSPYEGSAMLMTPVISWTGPVLLMVAAIASATPRKMLAFGFVAASMDPLGMFLARAAGLFDFEGVGTPFLMHFPTYLLLGVAVVISVVVTRLGHQVGRERELGSYHLGELLGRGGMGEVYRATHRMLARPAAIKLIRPEVLVLDGGDSAQTAVARFRREAEAAANLRSPHTVELYDFGMTEDRTLYFVMELLEGMDLSRLVREHGPVPAARVIHIVTQVCESLAEAHAAGLVHRDIKPANIHIGRLGLSQDFVKVLDFGLVKSVSAQSAHDSLATAAGSTPGTPAYMAPEMALGETVDGRADIYALGCVGYYLLTGKTVFEGDQGIQAIVKHVHATPVPPSRRVANPIPALLEEAVLACLGKAPEDRPQSALELQRRLREVPVEPWTQSDAAGWWRARPVMAESS
jgi:hypothetical protein